MARFFEAILGLSPVGLFVVSAPAPHLCLGCSGGKKDLEKCLSGKDDHDLPKAIVDDAEAREPFLESIRTDIAGLEVHVKEYSFRDDTKPLQTPIQVYAGKGELPEANLTSWGKHSQHSVEVQTFAKGHFFLLDNDASQALLLDISMRWQILGDANLDVIDAVGELARTVLGGAKHALALAKSWPSQDGTKSFDLYEQDLILWEASNSPWISAKSLK
jgi:hypothetical protein